jgi:Ca2+-binding RTX toxin-like protein
MPKPIPNTQTGSLTDHQHGTNDTLLTAFAYGDAFDMYDSSRGGNDTLIGVTDSYSQFYGDAGQMYDDSRGGNDTLIGGDGSGNDLIGEAFSMNGNAVGGNDVLTGGDGSPYNSLYGDAFTMNSNAVGGNDVLTGGDGSYNALTGDASSMSNNAAGGNDLLAAGDGSNNALIGDASRMDNNAIGGNDTLISGTGTDHMWGDAQVINDVWASPTAPLGAVSTGADTFVFVPDSGNDFIYDFRQSDHDKINVSAYGFHSIGDMVITDTGADTKIAFDATNSVTLVGFGDPNLLHASDFIFA